jgi:hypothetical protein
MNSRSAKARLAKSAALLLAGLAVVCLGQSQEPEPSLDKDHPLLEIDLHKFGYDTSRSTKHLSKFVPSFTDSTHLAIAWLTLDDPTIADKTGPATARPAHLHVLVIDATTGQEIGAQTWPTPSTPVRFLAARDGKFLTCTGNILRLFSPTFEVIREKSPVGRACLSMKPGGISPSRRSLLLSSYLGQQSYEDALLDVETFAAIAQWTEKIPIDNASDHWLVASCGPKRAPCIRGIDKSWQSFQPSGMDKAVTQFRFELARFVSDDTLVMGWDKMSMVKVDGTELFHLDFPRGRSFEGTVTSTDGGRFAVIEDRQRGITSQPLDMYALLSNDRAVVYSVADRRAIYAVKVRGSSPWPPWATHNNHLALSADGTLLAIVDGGDLKVYRLPGIKSAH